MKTESLPEIVAQLSPEEQAAVREFIDFLRGRKSASGHTPFLAAVDEFIAAHAELLRRLAQ
jgi:hypothetical protein